MSCRIGINGFGRIGRMVLRRILERPDMDIEVVAIDDLAPIGELAYLLKYDSVHGFLREDVSNDEQMIHVAGRDIRFFEEAEPAKIPWGSVGADIVIESTGAFRGREDAGQHLQAGARKVIISAPSNNVDVTLVLGVNEEMYDPARHDIGGGGQDRPRSRLARRRDQGRPAGRGCGPHSGSYTGSFAYSNRPRYRDLSRRLSPWGISRGRSLHVHKGYQSAPRDDV